jgi:hypothetical protein
VQHVLKLHFLQSHLDFLPGNTGAVSEEHDENPSGYIPNGKNIQLQMEPKYLGWTLVQEPPAEEYKETKDSKMSF